MDDQDYVSLRERAIQAWHKVRPNYAARLMKQADRMLELRKKLEEVLGSNLPIRIVPNLGDRPVAEIDDLRFALTTIGEDGQKRLVLIDPCPRCGSETVLVIDALADLGKLFDRFGATLYLGCSECVGFEDDELCLELPAT